MQDQLQAELRIAILCRMALVLSVQQVCPTERAIIGGICRSSDAAKVISFTKNIISEANLHWDEEEAAGLCFSAQCHFTMIDTAVNLAISEM